MILKVLHLILVIIGLFVFQGCTERQGPAPSAMQFTRIIVDMCGRAVNLPEPEKIARVAILTSPTVQIMYIVGEQDKLCAMTAGQSRFMLFERFYPRQKNIPAPRKRAGDMNVEALLNTDPQFCIGSETDMDVVEKNTNITTVCVATTDPRNVFEGRKKEVQLFGKIFGKEDRAKKYCDYLDETLARIRGKTADIPEAKKVRVYMGYGSDHLTTYGYDTYMQVEIAASGCRNAAEEVSTIGGREGGMALVSFEQILSWDPDVMVIDTGSVEELRKDLVWANIKAVKEENVFILPVGGFIWNRASCESAVLLPLWLAYRAYPDRFPEISMKDEIKRYWKEIFGFAISDEDVDSMLNPAPAVFLFEGKGSNKDNHKKR